jgi:hypothetical protein
MNKNGFRILCSSIVLSMVASMAQATLFDRGNGMIYDSDQDLTWLQDANYAKTSGFDSDGEMNWNSATGWAAGLSIGGYTNWRLASVTDSSDDGCDFSFTGTDCGYNVDTSGSELAYMWYETLGNKSYYDTSGNADQPGWGLTSTSADGVDILNLQSDYYWSGTEYAPGTDNAWHFNTDDGGQYGDGSKGFEFYAWAVRSGDVAAVPEPSTLILFGFGLAGLGAVRRGRRQR